MKTYDIIVIGGGVAGMNCALYALRNGKSVLIFEGDGVGGQIANSPKVEKNSRHPRMRKCLKQN